MVEYLADRPLTQKQCLTETIEQLHDGYWQVLKPQLKGKEAGSVHHYYQAPTETVLMYSFHIRRPEIPHHMLNVQIRTKLSS